MEQRKERFVTSLHSIRNVWLGAIAINALVNVSRFYICCSGKEGPFSGSLFAISAKEFNGSRAGSGQGRAGVHACTALQLCVVIFPCPSLWRPGACTA